MSSITLVTYSHSEYDDIVPLTQEGVRKIQVPGMKKVFASNLPLTSKEGYDSCIQYTDSLTYPQKLCEIAAAIQTDYIFLLHDIDYVVGFNNELFENVNTLLTRHSIDRLCFGMVPAQSTVLQEGPIHITNMNKQNITPNFYTPYDSTPSIWRTECLLQAMGNESSFTYRTVEFSGIQDFLCTKNVYAFTPSPSYSSVYQIGRPFSSEFTFLHLLTRGMWLHSRYYMDCEKQFQELLQKFSVDISKRGILDTPHLDSVSRVV